MPLAKVINISEMVNRRTVEPKNNKEEKQMKKSVIKFSETAKKSVLRSSGAILTVIAAYFASVACMGHVYEPEVPEKLARKK